MRCRRRRTGWAALLLAGGLAVAAQARIIGRSSEISIGREVASQVEREYVVDRDAVSVSRVRQIGRRLAAVVPGQDFPFEFHVVENGEVNAFALPGGYIYVHRGLLQLIPNDDALAFVLAHEISHVTRRHGIRQLEKNVVIAAALQGVLAGTGVGGGAAAGASLLHTIVGLSFTRSDETEADQIGIELLARAGYDPAAAPQAMALVKRAIGSEGKDIPRLLRSHPAPETRIRKLNALAETFSSERDRLRREAPAPPPAPLLEGVRLAGLEGMRVAVCPWWPLIPGARWTYRTGGTPEAPPFEMRVLEAVPAEPAGVFRVEYDLGRGVKATRLVAPAGDRCLTRPDPAPAAAPWRTEAVFVAAEPGALPSPVRYAGMEKIQVPAGEFDAARVEMVGPDGAIEAVAWYARDVGLIRHESKPTGTLRELLQYRIPAPLQRARPGTGLNERSSPPAG